MNGQRASRTGFNRVKCADKPSGRGYLKKAPAKITLAKITLANTTPNLHAAWFYRRYSPPSPGGLLGASTPSACQPSSPRAFKVAMFSW
jgi:hypothetical protein